MINLLKTLDNILDFEKRPTGDEAFPTDTLLASNMAFICEELIQARIEEDHPLVLQMTTWARTRGLLDESDVGPR